MSDFRPLSENELAALSIEKLLAYHHETRELGRHEEARTALGILVWGAYDRVEFWVKMKTPPERVEDLVSEVIASALKSSFDGTTIPQFMAWLRTIAKYRVADYHKAREGRPDTTPLPDEHGEDDEIWGPSLSVPDPTEAVVEQSIIDQAMGELNPVHRRVVELAGPQDLGFEQRPARETAEKVNDQFSGELKDPMTESNVHQILARFRRFLRGLLDDA